MESPYGSVKKSIAGLVDGALQKMKVKAPDLESSIDFSKGFGDVSCSIAFGFARDLKKAPAEIAKVILGNMEKPAFIDDITADKGFVNFYLNREWFAKEVINYSLKLKPGKISDIGKMERVIIEYPSANPVHPLHVGQLRNALLGDTLANAYEAVGYEVEREDYIDDLGLQMMEAMWGYLHLKPKPGKKFDHALGEVYVETNKYMETHDLKEELSQLAQLTEQDGTMESIAGREIAENCAMAQNETMFDYGIYHNVMVWESDILRNRLMDKAMSMLLKAGFVERIDSGEYKGCVVIDLTKIKNLPKDFRGLKEMTKVLIRADGTPTYVAKDIAFHMWKFGMLENTFKYREFVKEQENGKPLFTTNQTGETMEFGDAKKAINIIDVKQSFPQELLKLAFRIMKREDITDNIIHLAYGRVELEEGTLAGRKGTWVGNTADDLLDEATKKAETLLGTRFKLSEKERKGIARSVALAAIKFEFLKVAPETAIIFSWKWALSFEGNSGPYCQYTYARAMRLITDSKFDIRKAAVDYPTLSGDRELALLKLLSKSKETAEKTAGELRPNVLTDYAIELASAFSKFYEASPILKAATEKERDARLSLTIAFTSTMFWVLTLLGIEPIEKM